MNKKCLVTNFNVFSNVLSGWIGVYGQIVVQAVMEDNTQDIEDVQMVNRVILDVQDLMKKRQLATIM